MKKRVIATVFTLAVLLILFCPIPCGTYRDGGTKDYRALTYRIVKWNRLSGPSRTYTQTSVFWFPENFKSIDELWELETARNGGAESGSSGASEEETEALKEKYPEYFGLSADKGLEIYVWQMAPESFSFGLTAVTDGEKTFADLLNLKGASADEMKAILSTYPDPENAARIIPWQNPVSSYIGEYWIGFDEDPVSAETRRRDYIEMIRSMLFDGVSERQTQG